MKNALIIFVKHPVAGRVKTRIAEDAGDDRALEIYRELLRLTALHCNAAAGFCDLHVFYGDAPLPVDDDFTHATARHVQVQTDDLGDRMRAAFDAVFSLGYTRAVIVGSDCPYLRANQIKHAFEALNVNDTVIGPSLDGGFYLLAAKRSDHLIFDGITWSSPTVLETLIKNLQKRGIAVAKLSVMEDIDTLAAFERYKSTEHFE